MKLNTTPDSQQYLWQSPLFIITFSLLLFLVVSGAITFFWSTTHFFIQFNVLFHTGLGILSGILMFWFYFRHWIETRMKREKQRRWVGHIGGQLFLVTSITGFVLIFTGVSGKAVFIYWVHIIIGIFALWFIGYHVFVPVVKKSQLANGQNFAYTQVGIRKQGLFYTILCVISLMIVPLGLGFVYHHSTQIYNEDILNTYSYPYGSEPFLPSMTRTANSNFIREEVMVGSESCGQQRCHTDIYEQWSESVHRYSTDNPYFEQTILYMAEVEGNNATRYCGGCHDPIALLSGKMDANGPVRNEHKGEGISCVICHSITRINDLAGTGGYTFAPPDRYLFWNSRSVILDYFNSLLIRLKPKPHSDTFMKTFYKTPEYCSVCHKQSIDEQTNHYRWLRLQNQYDPWQKSGFSGESVFTYYPEERKTCNDCHMQGEASNDPSGDKGQVKSHRFIAANTAIPFLNNHKDQLRQTIDWLKRDEVDVDIIAMIASDSGNTITMPLNRVKPNLIPGSSVVFDVCITNNVAHNFPTGPLDLYEAWLEFIVTDAQENIIYSSGLIGGDGVVDPNAHQHISPPVTRDSEWIRKHNLWDTHTAPFNHSIPAQSSDVVHFNISIPESSQLPYRVTSRVQYRRFNRWYTEWVLGENAPEFPVVELCADTVYLVKDYNVHKSKVEDYLRFNRYGIGLLRQQRYADAIIAFERAIRLNPGYLDGYVNIGLVNLESGYLSEAEEWIVRALEINPDFYRAQAYLGIIRQKQGLFDKAIAVLQNVMEVYPRDRRLLYETGRSYYLARDYEKAMGMFLRARDVDPEDASVHYNLALCFSALGKEKDAQKHRKLFLKYKKDPSAPGRIKPFLLTNDWAMRESQLQHVH